MMTEFCFTGSQEQSMKYNSIDDKTELDISMYLSCRVDCSWPLVHQPTARSRDSCSPSSFNMLYKVLQQNASTLHGLHLCMADRQLELCRQLIACKIVQRKQTPACAANFVSQSCNRQCTGR
ncbi:hypothetical protein ABBQ32_14120 [Trebouxia sp. C0010 RCD-2024]